MKQILFISDNKDSEYLSFIDKYLTYKNRWDTFVTDMRREFKATKILFPLYDKDNKEGLESIDYAMQNMLVEYDTELTPEAKILMGLQVYSVTEHTKENKVSYVYKIRNYINNPIINKYISIVEDTMYPVYYLFNFLRYPAMLMSSIFGRVFIVLPEIALYNKEMRLSFMYDEDNDILLHEPSIPHFIKQQEVIDGTEYVDKEST